MTTTNSWILDSQFYLHTKLLISQINHAKLLELSFNNELDEFIVQTIEPFLDEYNELSKNTNNNHLLSNTKQLMAKEWLYAQIENHLNQAL